MVLAGVVWREALKGTCFKRCGPRGVYGPGRVVWREALKGTCFKRCGPRGVYGPGRGSLEGSTERDMF